MMLPVFPQRLVADAGHNEHLNGDFGIQIKKVAASSS